MERDSFKDYCVVSDLVDEFITTEPYSPKIDVKKFMEAIKKEPYQSFILDVILTQTQDITAVNVPSDEIFGKLGILKEWASDAAMNQVMNKTDLKFVLSLIASELLEIITSMSKDNQ